MDYFTFNGKSAKTGPKILIVAGTHGNEPAGSIATKKLVNDFTTGSKTLNKGQLILVPKINNCGLQTNSRFIPFVWDLNRQYPKTHKEHYKMISRSKTINDSVCELVQNADFILDFHEGWSYQSKDKSSVGSTLTPSITTLPNNLSLEIVDILNRKIPNDKRFMIMTDFPELVQSNSRMYAQNEEIKGTLRYYCNLLKKDYILIETTGQDDVQPIQTRVDQCNTIINYVLNHFGMM